MKKIIVEDDHDVYAALSWLTSVSEKPGDLVRRLERAQDDYRIATELEQNLGRDLGLRAISEDVVSAYLAQAKSMLEDLRTYDFALASRVLPWVKQLGANTDLMPSIEGADNRALRMWEQATVPPDSAMFELVMASNYAAGGFEVQFIPELKGKDRTPDFRISLPREIEPVVVECKRLQQGKYELEEKTRHSAIFRNVAALIDNLGLSVHLDVTYIEPLDKVPDDYLLGHLKRLLSSRIITAGHYPWNDEYGYGEIRPANLTAVRRELRDSSLYFGTKLGRLLCGQVVREDGFHLAAGAQADPRDPRYIDKLFYGSIITWQCISPVSLEKKARYVTAKLSEADRQLKGHGPGIIHIAMDMQIECQSSDLRRVRNLQAIKNFKPDSELLAIYIHYLVPRNTEAHSWSVDETVDRFGPGHLPVPTFAAFPLALRLNNNLPGWRQKISPQASS
jgi:hypothetical protein